MSNNIMPDNAGHIYIYGPVGNMGDCSDCVTSANFISEFKYLESMYSKICVHINSVGGSIIEGYAIYTTLLDSKSEIVVYIDGLAGSIAGVISMAGDYIYMRDYSLLMLHNPSNGTDKQLNVFKETLVKMISKRTNKNPEEISKMMNDETWLNADEAMKLGFIDEIIETDEKEAMEEEINNLYSVSNSINDLDLYNVFNKKINNNMNNKAEENFFKKLWAMANKADELTSEDSTISDLKNEIESLKKAIEDEKSSKAELTNKIAEFEAKEKEVKEKEVVDFLNTCIETNVIKSDDYNKFYNLASVDFTTTKELLEKSKKSIGEPTNIVNQLIVNEIKNLGEGRDKWSLMDWAKNDPKGLEELKVKNSILYDELINRSNEAYKSNINLS